jgi:hypothetical protein
MHNNIFTQFVQMGIQYQHILKIFIKCFKVDTKNSYFGQMWYELTHMGHMAHEGTSWNSNL